MAGYESVHCYYCRRYANANGSSVGAAEAHHEHALVGLPVMT
jgi:hypothetical protein